MNKSIPSSRENPHLQFGRKKILQILQEIEGGLSRKEACQRYGMAYSTITEWFGLYGSEQYQAIKRRRFSVLQKRSIIQSVLVGRMTKDEACVAFKLSKKLLGSWILQFQRDSEAVVNNHSVMQDANTTTTAPTDPIELQQAKLKIEALETLIDIAEQELKISIRKKCGAKQ